MVKESEDEIISKRKFQKGSGVDLGSFLIDSEPKTDVPVENLEIEDNSKEEVDIAIGEIAEIFTRGDAPSRINRDGTVDEPPEIDSVTEYAIEGEKRIHFGLMISMIVVWSAIGAIVGTTLGPTLSAIGLLAMAGFGIWLGEVWIPKNSMHILGVTWVIISMKLLYGLAISMYSWDWITQTELGVGLLGLVTVNIFIAQHHNEDAIAAQATLVLLAIGSAAGGPYGQEGVAAMIGLGTLLLHALAYLRKSGNLASLGIAVSYLWIGLHAISNNWILFGIEIKPFEDELLLFLLMFAVTGINAITATRFAKAENWFSSAFNAMGLGKPGLWSVSVGLGMFGALLAIASHRLETGYAIAQLILLISAFGPSYLVVRGEDWNRLQRYALWPAPLLLAILILMVRGIIEPPFSEPWAVYAVFSASLTTFALLNHQHAVSDHVLWIGSIVMVILLTLLINAEEATWARNLLVCQAIVWVGLSWLAIQRNSPSLAGTATLAPWIWLLLFASNIEDRLISVDLIPINIAEFDLTIYMLLLIAIQIPLNLKLGDTGVNLAGRLAGLSELSARMRDSGMMRLWNISFITVLGTILFLTHPGIIPSYGLLLIMGVLLLSHALIMRFDKHQGNPRTILVSWAIAALILQWRFGFGAFWVTILGISSVLIVRWSEENALRLSKGEVITSDTLMPGKLITITLGFISVMMMLIGLDEPVNTFLTDSENLPSGVENLRYAGIASMATLGGLYLPRASKLDRLLPSAIASIAVLVTVGLAANSFEDFPTIALTGASFVITGAWLAAQGEIRSRLRQVSQREERIAKHLVRAELKAEITAQQDESSHIRMIDTELLQLSEAQKKRSRRRSSSGEYDLIVGDINHKPIIVISFISVTLLIGVFFSWTSGSSLLAIAMASFISVLFIGISRWRAEQVNLQLPDIMGIESPIAVTMAGLTLIQIAGRLGDSSVELVDQWEVLVLLGSLIILAGISLVGRKDLGLRIPSALEGIVLLVLVSRLLTTLMGVDRLQLIPNLSNELKWVVPVWGLEVFLIGAVLLFNWVESERIKRNLEDHRGAAGRFAWAAMVIVISFGPAGILACGLALFNAIKWAQPAIPVGLALFLPISWNALGDWIELLDETTALFMIAIGIIGLASAVICVIYRKEIWTPAGLWIGHLLIPTGAFGHYEQTTVLMMVLVLAVSTTSWMIGVITLRRAWRIIGAIDLVIAWIIAGVLLLAGATEMMILIMLLATAILLGLVTWLGQKYESEISNT
ncbi:MAG: hypothetical protein HOE76_01005 [Euryarchaeota archaeon]|jgi:hypothetical protein|nr:hypothetical protein [Euryarchaeota archaeon]MBT4982528.1 hypothetical protein [Euryarchaeota archaeon]MBT5184749.1 hypothetical protein [Euryarchaeota archaeon]